MSDEHMLISNKIHYFRNFRMQIYNKYLLPFFKKCRYLQCVIFKTNI